MENGLLYSYATYQGFGEREKIKAMAFEKQQAYAKDNMRWATEWNKYCAEQRDTNYEFAYWKLVEGPLVDTVSSEVRVITSNR